MVTFRQNQSIPERQRLKVAVSERGSLLKPAAKDAYVDYVYKPGIQLYYVENKMATVIE